MFKRKIVKIPVIIATALIFLAVNDEVSAQEYDKTKLIVTYNENIRSIENLPNSKSLLVDKEVESEVLEGTKQEIIEFDNQKDASDAKLGYEADRNVMFVEYEPILDLKPNKLVNDTLYESQWQINFNSSIPYDNMIISRLNHNSPSNKTVRVAVIDFDFDFDNEDIAHSFEDGFDTRSGKLQSQGGNMKTDGYGRSHGTSVVSMVKAQNNNNEGLASPAGFYDNIKIVPIMVYGGLEAINHAIERDVDIVNMSFDYGTTKLTSYEIAYERAVKQGIILVGASGNNGRRGSMFPASSEYVISVGSVGKDMNISSFSNYGADVDYYAAGESTLAAMGIGYYTTNSGTSLSAPHFAGILATMKAVSPNITNEEMLEYINETAYVKGVNFAKGYPNAVEAVRLARINSGQFTKLRSEYNVSVNKVWSILFNAPIDKSHLKNFYVLDKDNGYKEHAVIVTINPKNPIDVIITPKRPYKENGNYILVASDAKTTGGIYHRKQVMKEFHTEIRK